MRLAHNPNALETLRSPSDDAPWRVLVSGCLWGQPCGVDASDYGMSAHQPPWLHHRRVEIVPFCPEDFGMGTPRGMPDLHGGDGFDVLDGRAKVLDEHGNDLTQAMLRGARAMADTALEHKVDFALLTDRSGACGTQVISLGCRFVEPVQYRRGVGVAAAMLLRCGVAVVSQRDFHTLSVLGSKVDEAFEVDAEALDHHQTAWVKQNLP